jgi:glyoxylase-like metal-dependent hydrolase (beta-lactamase superfamily II)
MKPRFVLLLTLLHFLAPVGRAVDLPTSLRFKEGSHNEVSIVRGEGKLDVNLGADRDQGVGEIVLFTHARREVVKLAVPLGEAVMLHAPAASREFLEGTSAFWEQWWTKRFDYYEQQVTRRPVRDLPADRYLEDGETFTWRDLEFRFLATPGYTRDGGTYVTTLDGVKVAFAGELLREGGRVTDLYSFQEAIPEAKVGGYHGYLGRLSQWLASLEKLAAEKPDLIVPWRGPVITDPARDLAAAVDKARAIYRNYLETNALHWYFGEERMSLCAERVLGPDHGVKGMPLAEHVDLPEWCRHIGTTKLLVSASGRGFLLDVGGPSAVKSLEAFRAEGLVKEIDGIFTTHVHNDHTAAIAEAARLFDCPVYATPEVAPVLERPGDWFLPGVTPNVVDPVVMKQDGETMKWEEFTFTFRSFPGQMLNHGALLVEKAGETPVFFIGDSFSPSGIDDYCLMNRNLMREDAGYLKCFAIVAAMPKRTWLVNQHIPHLFRFNEKEADFLLSRYRERIAMIADFVTWDDVNFAIDEQWAWFHPYGIEAKRGETVTLTMRLSNHSTEERTYSVSVNSPISEVLSTDPLRLAARSDGKVTFPFVIPADAAPGVQVVTADVGRSDGLTVPHWAEALIKVVE